MFRSLLIAGLVVSSPAVMSQQQQAGNAASTDTEGTFQALVDACDDVDALMLRARIRLQLPRTTEQAAADASDMLDKGFATCGSGDLDGAKAILTEALAVAEAGVSEKFNAEPASQTDQTQAQTQTQPVNDTDTENTDAKPWWKFW